MAAPTGMGPYEYQFKDSGFRLNTNPSLPFVDLYDIKGLDTPQFEANIDSISGQHGGTVSVAFMPHRLIVGEGILFASPNTIDATLNTLVSNFLPDNMEYPFWFTESDGTLRYCLGKSLGLRHNLDRGRSRGESPLQFQIACQDPRKYVDNANQTMVANTNYTPANAGNIETYPIFTVTGAWSTISFTNNTQAKTVTLTRASVAGDVVVVDFRKRSVRVNGILMSSIVTTGGWWAIPAGGGQTVKYTVTGGPPTSVVVATKQGWV